MSWLERLLKSFGPEAEAPAPRGDPERVRAVAVVLDELAPMFLADGGEVRLVAIEDGWVIVSLRGACKSCSASDMSLHGALEPRLKARFDWVQGVRAVG